MEREAIRRAQKIGARAESEDRLLTPSEVEEICDALTQAGLMHVAVRGDGIKVYRAKLEFAKVRAFLE